MLHIMWNYRPSSRTSWLRRESLFVEHRQVGQLVVGDHVGFGLRIGQMLQAYRRDLFQAQNLRCRESAMASNDLTLRINQDGGIEAEGLDAVCDGPNLPPRMRSRICGVGGQGRQRQIVKGGGWLIHMLQTRSRANRLFIQRCGWRCSKPNRICGPLKAEPPACGAVLVKDRRPVQEPYAILMLDAKANGPCLPLAEKFAVMLREFADNTPGIRSYRIGAFTRARGNP